MKQKKNRNYFNGVNISNFIKLFFVLIWLTSISCHSTIDSKHETNKINKLLDNWHHAAAVADTSFFNYFDSNAIYIGTDATERWTNEEFKSFAMPYFKKGKAWDFKPIERRIYFANSVNTAWFNETLDTWMGICRSSGVLEMNDKEEWKIKHYHLSCTVPNEKVRQFIELINQMEK